MKRNKILALASLIFAITVLSAFNADAYRYRRHRWYKPKVGFSLSGGLTVFHMGPDDYWVDGPGVAEYGIVQMGVHYWILPRLSLDMALAYNSVTGDGSNVNYWWSVLPGIRFAFGPIYLRGAIDIGKMDRKDDRALFVFGALVGVGARARFGRHFRVFGEIDIPILYEQDFAVPAYVHGGIELVF